MSEAFYMIGVEILCNRPHKLLGLSQKSYINKFLERFGVEKCYASVVLIQKGDKFNLMQCPKNKLECKKMENIPYASIVGRLMYAQTYTRPDISFVIGMLGKYQSNPAINYQKNERMY